MNGTKKLATANIMNRMTTNKLGEAMVLAIEIIENRDPEEIRTLACEVGDLLHHTAINETGEFFTDAEKVALANWVLDQHVDWNAVGDEVIAFLDQAVIADRMKDAAE